MLKDSAVEELHWILYPGWEICVTKDEIVDEAFGVVKDCTIVVWSFYIDFKEVNIFNFYTERDLVMIDFSLFWDSVFFWFWFFIVLSLDSSSIILDRILLNYSCLELFIFLESLHSSYLGS